eukprot:gnl/TRDRNA2_/TRDRNA2_201187_c0_seq1.p1 gnl/TRDRNA2_/TRDRNA2_201187_c0~~gnl/TRDRNA2_/TRDRNA2_201187_c0_seq1.p1  ORF type:complete len:218 (-),score=56.46 gnl/TRDRNA2_/TRDRNA2_201187_c0_seq1:210-863(-)
MASSTGGGSSAGGGSTKHDLLVKLLLVGDSGVGKSSLLLKFVDDSFSPHITQTIGIDFKVKMLDLGGKRVKVQIWDTAGQERFHTITQQYYRSAMGIVLVYDVTSEESFANVRHWAAQIAAHGVEGTSRLLVGNKADHEQKVVDASRGQALADEYSIPFFETSAKTGANVGDAFVTIADAVRLRLQDGAAGAPSGLRVSGSEGEQRRHSSCCGKGGE